MKRSVQIAVIDVNEKSIRRLERQLNDILEVEPNAKIELFPVTSSETVGGVSQSRPQIVTFVRSTQSETMERPPHKLTSDTAPVEPVA